MAGKCPCYEHERKTVMADPNPTQPGGRHEERMAELRDRHSAIQTDRGFRLAERSALFNDALAYADSLAAQLEAERAKVAELEREVALDDQLLADRQRILDSCPCPVHGACIPHVLETLAKSKAAEEKLRAAEAVVEASRIVAKWDDPEARMRPWFPALHEALSAYDAINPEHRRRGRG